MHEFDDTEQRLQNYFGRFGILKDGNDPSLDGFLDIWS